MTVSYSSSPLKSARMANVITALDANALPAYIEICTQSYVSVIATLTLSDPSFIESGGVITMTGAPKAGVASLAGTNGAVLARIKDGGGNTIINNLTVGISSADITLSVTSITAGQTVTINSLTINHSP